MGVRRSEEYKGLMKNALETAAKSSFATHPGILAAECCRFQTFLMLRAILRSETGGTDIKQFLESACKEYHSDFFDTNGSLNPFHRRIMESLIFGDREQETSKEANWNWRTLDYEMRCYKMYFRVPLPKKIERVLK